MRPKKKKKVKPKKRDEESISSLTLPRLHEENLSGTILLLRASHISLLNPQNNGLPVFGHRLYCETRYFSHYRTVYYLYCEL